MTKALVSKGLLIFFHLKFETPQLILSLERGYLNELCEAGCITQLE